MLRTPVTAAADKVAVCLLLVSIDIMQFYQCTKSSSQPGIVCVCVCVQACSCSLRGAHINRFLPVVEPQNSSFQINLVVTRSHESRTSKPLWLWLFGRNLDGLDAAHRQPAPISHLFHIDHKCIPKPAPTPIVHTTQHNHTKASMANYEVPA